MEREIRRFSLPSYHQRQCWLCHNYRVNSTRTSGIVAEMRGFIDEDLRLCRCPWQEFRLTNENRRNAVTIRRGLIQNPVNVRENANNNDDPNYPIPEEQQENDIILPEIREQPNNNLVDRVTRLEFNNLTGRVTGLEERMDRLEGRMNSLEERVQVLESKVDGVSEQMRQGFNVINEQLQKIQNSIQRPINNLQ